MEKYARKCDVTGKGMNTGWCWHEGMFYTSTEQVTIDELKKEKNILAIKDSIEHFDKCGNIEDLDCYEDGFEESVDRFKKGIHKPSDLLLIAYVFEYLYYSEWSCVDDEQDWYYDYEGNYFES